MDRFRLIDVFRMETRINPNSQIRRTRQNHLQQQIDYLQHSRLSCLARAHFILDFNIDLAFMQPCKNRVIIITMECLLQALLPPGYYAQHCLDDDEDDQSSNYVIGFEIECINYSIYYRPIDPDLLSILDPIFNMYH